MNDQKLLIDQSADRHIINVPMPFTREQLLILVKHCGGLEDDIVEEYVDHILEEGRVTLNPSDSLGDGANIVDIFSFGFVMYMKDNFNIDIDQSICWWHPMSLWVPTNIGKVEYEKTPVQLTVAPEHEGMTCAIEEATDRPVKIIENEIIYSDELPHSNSDDYDHKTHTYS